MVLNLQRVPLPAIGADFCLRLLRGDPLPPPAHEQLDDLIFAVAQVHAAGGRMKSSAPALSVATPSRQQQQRRRHARVAKPADPFRRVFAKLFSPRRGENSPFLK